MLLLSQNDFSRFSVYNFKIERISDYIRAAELDFLRDIDTQFAVEVEYLVNNLPTSFFISNINNLLFYPREYRDVAVYYVVNYLLRQNVLSVGVVNEKDYTKHLYVSYIGEYYKYVSYVLQTHNVLYFNSNNGYCLYEQKYKNKICFPPLESVLYRDDNNNLYSVSLVSPLNTAMSSFAVNILPTPTSDTILYKYIPYTKKEYIRLI